LRSVLLRDNGLLGRVIDRAVLNELMDAVHVLVNEDVGHDVHDDDGTDDYGILAQECQEDDGRNRVSEHAEGGNHCSALQADTRGDGNLSESRSGERAEVQAGDHVKKAADEGLQDVAIRASDEGLNDVGNSNQIEHGENEIARQDKGNEQRGRHKKDAGDKRGSLTIASCIIHCEIPLTVIVTGIKKDDTVLNVVADKSGFKTVSSKKYGGSFSGTGDLFAAAVAGLTVKGETPLCATEKAVEFLEGAIRDSYEENTDRNFGVNFEKYLGKLM